MRRFMSILIALSVVALAAIGVLTAPQARLLLPAAAIPTRAAYLPAIFKPEQTPTSTAFPTAEATKTLGPTETAEPTRTEGPTETPMLPTETAEPTRTETPTMTPCPVLEAPTLGASRSGSTVMLSWNAVSGAVSYKVYRSSVGSSGPFSLIASPTGTSASDTIPQHTTYWYYVTAINACGVQSPVTTADVVSVTRP